MTEQGLRIPALEQGAPRPLYPLARGDPPLDSGMRRSNSAKRWGLRKKLEETEMQFHGHNENTKKGGGESELSLPPFFMFSRMHSIRLAAIAAVPVGDNRYSALHRHVVFI